MDSEGRDGVEMASPIWSYLPPQRGWIWGDKRTVFQDKKNKVGRTELKHGGPNFMALAGILKSYRANLIRWQSEFKCGCPEF